MPWTKLDDGFYMHPKIVTVGNAGAGLYCRALAYCAAHLTDGEVPGPMAAVLAGGDDELLQALVDVGLWRREPDGSYLIPDYLDLNPSRADVEERRERQRQGGQKGGRKSGETRRDRATGGLRRPSSSRWLEALEGGEAS